MLNTLTLKIPDYIYQTLQKRAVQVGETLEQIALKYIENAIKDVKHDPLLDLAGVLEYDKNDIAENHDTYIGKGLKSQ